MSGPTSLIDVTREPDHVALPGGREPGEPGQDAMSHGAFARWLLGAVAVAMLAIGALNWVVDPTGVTGRTTRWQVADNSAVRSAKLDLYERALASGTAPEVVLLGSSRTMKFQPATVRQLTGASAFNAAVSGGVPRDAYLFTRWMLDRQRRFGDVRMPHLVWGLDADAFREKQLREGLATDPRMSRYVPLSDRLATRVASLGALTEWQTLDATLRSLRSGGSVDTFDGPRFDDDGFQLFSRAFEERDVLRNRAIRRQTTNYANFVFERDGWEGVEDEPLDEFVRTVRLANEHGDEPTIFITPYHPIAEQQLARYDLARRRREVLEELRALQRDGAIRFELVDFSDIADFDGDERQFYDGVHMTPTNTDRVLERLHERNLLAP